MTYYPIVKVDEDARTFTCKMFNREFEMDNSVSEVPLGAIYVGNEVVLPSWVVVYAKASARKMLRKEMKEMGLA